MTPAGAAAPKPPLPRDCRLQALDTHADRRGDLTEVFREEWLESPAPRIWSVVRGHNEMRTGLRVSVWDWTYLSLLDGAVLAGLLDLRPAAPAANPALVAISETPRQMLAIAPGVAYGLYFPRPGLCLMGRAAGTDPADGLLCAWDSPGLDIPWPSPSVDRAAAPRTGLDLAEFKARFAALASRAGDG